MQKNAYSNAVLAVNVIFLIFFIYVLAYLHNTCFIISNAKNKIFLY